MLRLISFLACFAQLGSRIPNGRNWGFVLASSSSESWNLFSFPEILNLPTLSDISSTLFFVVWTLIDDVISSESSLGKVTLV